MIHKLQNFIEWVNKQVFKTNPPKEQPAEQKVQVEELPIKKPRKPRVKKVVE